MTHLEILLIFVFLLYYFCYIRPLEKELNKYRYRKKIDLSQAPSFDFDYNPDEPPSRPVKIVAIIFATTTWLIILISLFSFFIKLF